MFKDVLESKDGNLVVRDELELFVKGSSVHGVCPVGYVHTRREERDWKAAHRNNALLT